MVFVLNFHAFNFNSAFLYTFTISVFPTQHENVKYVYCILCLDDIEYVNSLFTFTERWQLVIIGLLHRP